MKTFDQVPIRIGARLLPAGDNGSPVQRTVILAVAADGDSQPLIQTCPLSEFHAMWDAALVEYAAQYARRVESRQETTQPAAQDQVDAGADGQLTLLSLDF